MYPDADEKSVVLGTVQLLVGPPSCHLAGVASGHWDNWEEVRGDATKAKKHKGATIGDLERARGNPSAYGVTGLADLSGIRPSRPVRQLAPINASSTALTVLAPGVVAGAIHAEPLPTALTPVVAHPAAAAAPPAPAADGAPTAAPDENVHDDPEGDEQATVLAQLAGLQGKVGEAKKKQDEAKENKKRKAAEKKAGGAPKKVIC